MDENSGAQPTRIETAPELLPQPSSIQPARTSNLALRTSDVSLVVEAEPVSVQVRQPHKARRKGRIAALPKLQRDMVNRMIWNGVPYKNIVEALHELCFSVTERNISNWATGGYLEWRLDQEIVLQNRLDQDSMLDHLRRDTASELPEVGLQAAATRLSQILVQKTANAENVEADLGSFSKMVDVLCRLNREITALQEHRDNSRRSLGRHNDPNRIKHSDQESAIQMERFYSNPPPDSKLSKPAEPPFLPPSTTSSFLEQCDREAAQENETRRQEFMASILGPFGTKQSAPTPPPKPPPIPASPANPTQRSTF
jgi:hypothetical protein